MKFKGSLNLKNIYDRIDAFDDYTMKENFAVMKDIPEEKFNLTKESDKLKLEIKFTVMKKEKHLIIELNPVSQSTDSIIQCLMKKNKNNEERLIALEKKRNELKNKITNKAIIDKNEKAKNDSKIKSTENIDNKIKLDQQKKFVNLSKDSYEDKDINLNIKGCTSLKRWKNFSRNRKRWNLYL